MEESPIKSDFWNEVLLEFEGGGGRVGTSVLHSNKGELLDLKEEILETIDTLEESGSYLTEYGSEGIPEEPIVPRELSHRLWPFLLFRAGYWRIN